ncbi:LysR family transcriptional regulator [Psychroserpens sp. SPM9]|uniref:LysR family transcriptional regulator n=1 Tax=Psychroserpens sp. SPM9 TaxID=2975598 RepID=UPI0021A48838|nr:LysR family transcriptional regulator [Psychroserpens sp. SPM9]MDG5492915.1 LysR family transcriptional regulator [Psychroserpens sp. SPM9]
MINLEWYRTFKAVYEEGNLTSASEALFSSQPGVSLHISNLEAYVGYKLFERTSRKMIPTERAIILYDYIIDALKKLEHTEQYFRTSKTNKRKTLSIGMCSEVFQTFFEPHIGKLEFDIIAHFGEYPQMLKELNEGILDLVITPEQIENPTLIYTPFFKEQILLVSNPTTDTSVLEAYIKGKQWDDLEKELKAQVWYGSSNVLGFSKKFWYQNFKKKQLYKPNYLVPNIISIIRCLKMNEGIALVPDFLCQEALEKNELELLWEGKKPLYNTFHFATKLNSKLQNEIEQIENLVIDS